MLYDLPIESVYYQNTAVTGKDNELQPISHQVWRIVIEKYWLKLIRVSPDVARPGIKSETNVEEVSKKKPAFAFQATAGGVGMTCSKSNFLMEDLKRLERYFGLFDWRGLFTYCLDLIINSLFPIRTNFWDGLHKGLMN